MRSCVLLTGFVVHSQFHLSISTATKRTQERKFIDDLFSHFIQSTFQMTNLFHFDGKLVLTGKPNTLVALEAAFSLLSCTI